VPSAEVRQRYQDNLIGTRAGQCRLCGDWYHYSVPTDFFFINVNGSPTLKPALGNSREENQGPSPYSPPQLGRGWGWGDERSEEFPKFSE